MAGSSLRSLRPAAVAVGVTGALSIAMPLVLMTGLVGFRGPLRSESDLLISPVVRSCAGEALAKPVILHPGDCAVVLVAGFAARQPVTVHDQNLPGPNKVVRADPAGGLSYRLVLGSERKPGRDVLSFVGQSQPVAGRTEDTAASRVSVCSFTVTAD